MTGTLGITVWPGISGKNGMTGMLGIQ